MDHAKTPPLTWEQKLSLTQSYLGLETESKFNDSSLRAYVHARMHVHNKLLQIGEQTLKKMHVCMYICNMNNCVVIGANLEEESILLLA